MQCDDLEVSAVLIRFVRKKGILNMLGYLFDKDDRNVTLICWIT